ncbi:MAG: hypothetical protein KAY54_01695 [Burkholderiaceae bacterium]|nr:hypothetical protein [Vitreoscilla sp.]MBP8100570.1 hypothetical protein [Burkholderiaceae bacterium]
MIRICFRYGDPQLFARLVCLLRGGDSAHCETAHRWVGDVYDCVSSSWMDGGVRGKLITMHHAKWRVYEVPGSPDDVRRWLKEHEGEKYDWLGILGFLVPWRWPAPNRRWFCSEASADHMWLRHAWRWDLFDLESVCKMLCKQGIARRVQ